MKREQKPPPPKFQEGDWVTIYKPKGNGKLRSFWIDHKMDMWHCRTAKIFDYHRDSLRKTWMYKVEGCLYSFVENWLTKADSKASMNQREQAIINNRLTSALGE